MRQKIIILAALLVWHSASAQERGLFGEVEIERGPEVSRLSVFVVNTNWFAQDAFQFEIARGGPGIHDDFPDKFQTPAVALPGGDAKAIPHLGFLMTNGLRIALEPPRFYSGYGDHAPRSQYVTVSNNSRVLCYSFETPTKYLGTFSGGSIAITNAFRVDQHGKRVPVEAGDLRITRASIKQEQKTPNQASEAIGAPGAPQPQR